MKPVIKHTLIKDDQYELEKSTQADSSSMQCCALADHEGLLAIGFRNDNNAECYFSESETKYINSKGRRLICYLEFPLTDSQSDIIRSIPSNDGKAALRAIRTYAGDDLCVPATQQKRWRQLSSLLDTERLTEMRLKDDD